MKLFLIALSLLSLPAFADTNVDTNAETDARVCLGNRNFGVCVNPGDRYGRDNGRDYGRDNGRDYGRDNGRDYGRDNGRDYGRDNGRDYGRDHGRDYGRDHGRDYGRDNGRDYGRSVTCVAENARGYRFRGVGRFGGEAQREAIGNCYNSGSRNCRVIGCR